VTCADCDLSELCRCARLRLAKAGLAPALALVNVTAPDSLVVLRQYRAQNVALVHAARHFTRPALAQHKR
jgi:hypothetical protein